MVTGFLTKFLSRVPGELYSLSRSGHLLRKMTPEAARAHDLSPCLHSIACDWGVPLLGSVPLVGCGVQESCAELARGGCWVPSWPISCCAEPLQVELLEISTVVIQHVMGPQVPVF